MVAAGAADVVSLALSMLVLPVSAAAPLSPDGVLVAGAVNVLSAGAAGALAVVAAGALAAVVDALAA
jgi:hypothetical protein